jgi:hypothetical protein
MAGEHPVVGPWRFRVRLDRRVIFERYNLDTKEFEMRHDLVMSHAPIRGHQAPVHLGTYEGWIAFATELDL